MVCFISCALLFLGVGFLVISADFPFGLDALWLVVIASSFAFNLVVLLLVSICTNKLLVVGKFTFSRDVLFLVVFRVDIECDFNEEIGVILPGFSNKLNANPILVVGNVFLDIASVGGSVTGVSDISV